MRWSVVVVLMWLISSDALAQESAMHADFRREGEHVAEACKDISFKTVPGCAIEFFTDQPLHIAAGSMPPQNGFGVGGAFVTGKNTKNWRISWDVDAVASVSSAWRAGGYMKMIHTPAVTIKPIIPEPGETPTPPSSKKPAKSNLVHPYAVFNLYAQSTSLNKINFFGLGNDSSLTGSALYGMTQTIIGGNVIKPVFEWPAISKLNLALLGELNGRFVDIRGDHGQSVPSIENLYTNATAPGLASQPGFVQFGEGIRVKPVIADRLQLNYLASFQQFLASSSSLYSFQRWTIDLNHTYFLYGYTKSAPKSTDMTGPDECAPSGQECPTVSHSRDLEGSIGLRLLLSESITKATSEVPFYYQPTLGGSDINSASSLSSYHDYRFRGPDLLLLRESFEHSIWGPFGFSFAADQGRVALTRGDIGFDHLKHSFATGLTLRAGGFPMVYVTFAWGGNEGHHTIANMNTTLLGGSSRPSLY
jgi:hypothetical protein